MAESQGTSAGDDAVVPAAVYNLLRERFTSVSEPLARLLGRSRDELEGGATLPGLDVDGGLRERAAALDGPTVLNCTLPDGRCGRVTLVPRADEVTVVVDAEADLDDATRERLRQQSTVLDTIVEHMPVTLFTLDAEGRYTRLAGKTLQYVDVDPSEVVGRSIFAATDHEGFHEAARRALDGEAVERDLTFDGRTSRSWYQPVFDADGEVDGVVGFALDITERRRRDQISDVLSRVLRHNLRNDMNVVLGNAENLAEHDDEWVREVGTRITATAERLHSLSETAREMRTRLLTGERMAPVSVREVVDHTARAAAEEHPTADIEVDLRDGTDVAVAGVDAVLTELVENAIRHNTGGARVVITVEPTDDGTRIVVEDEGPGIPEMEREVLEEGEEEPLAHGQGIGLWLVNWLVEDAGGAFHVEVTESGTRAVVTYPR